MPFNIDQLTIEELERALAAKQHARSASSNSAPAASACQAPDAKRGFEEVTAVPRASCSGILANIPQELKLAISEARSIHTIQHGAKSSLLDIATSALISLNR